VQDLHERYITGMETRHRLRLPLRCPVIFASDEFVSEGSVVNLGVPGCAVESDIAPLPGEYVRLHVLMPNDDGSLRVPVGKVRWSEGQHFGVEFLCMSHAHEMRLARLLKSPIDGS
jgi:hypothetical protein